MNTEPKGQMSVAALIDDIKIARRMLSAKNPTSVLLAKCEAAIVSLAIDLHRAKTKRSPWARLRTWFGRSVPIQPEAKERA